MTHEEFQQEVKNIPDLELIEKAHSALSKLCKTGGNSFTMTVPPRLDDTDILLAEVINRFHQVVIGESTKEESDEWDALNRKPAE